MSRKKHKIGRNEPCPCGSNKKFKRCHGGIDNIPTPNPGRIDAQLNKLKPKPSCLAPTSMKSSCHRKIISSHTISRSGSLSSITHNGHVYSFKTNLKEIFNLNGELKPQLYGWKEASTFPGFCSYHDKELFAPLEDQKFTGSSQQCFLLSYRAVAWELYAKQNSDNSSLYRTALVASAAPALQELIADFNNFNELGLNDAKLDKIAYDEVLEKELWSRNNGLLVEFKNIFPIQCSACWAPTEDINGNCIQVLTDKPFPPPSRAAINSFAAENNSYFLLSWLADSNTVVSKLADSLESLPQNKMASAIAALLLLTSENCHISPTWYDSLSELDKNLINSLMHPLAPIKPACATAITPSSINSIGIASIRRV